MQKCPNMSSGVKLSGGGPCSATCQFCGLEQVAYPSQTWILYIKYLPWFCVHNKH